VELRRGAAGSDRTVEAFERFSIAVLGVAREAETHPCIGRMRVRLRRSQRHSRRFRALAAFYQYSNVGAHEIRRQRVRCVQRPQIGQGLVEADPRGRRVSRAEQLPGLTYSHERAGAAARERGGAGDRRKQPSEEHASDAPR
jgi:hypothetical protein